MRIIVFHQQKVVDLGETFQLQAEQISYSSQKCSRDMRKR